MPLYSTQRTAAIFTLGSPSSKLLLDLLAIGSVLRWLPLDIGGDEMASVGYPNGDLLRRVAWPIDCYGSNAGEREFGVRCAAIMVSCLWRNDGSSASGIANPLDVEPDGERGPGSPRGVTDVTGA
ncbi:hypothetical protein GCM10009608_02910 [Pseudonocardia alaniniphila]